MIFALLASPAYAAGNNPDDNQSPGVIAPGGGNVIAPGGGNRSGGSSEAAPPPPPAADEAPAPAPAAPPRTRMPAPAPAVAPSATPSMSPSAAPSAVPSAVPTEPPSIVRIGTMAVLAIRAPEPGHTIAQRAAVVQSRLNMVLIHHPELSAADVHVKREGVTPVIYWGNFPIVSADAEHARLNNYSSSDLLASAWADSLRKTVRAFFAAKHMPERALYHTLKGGDFVYRRTDNTMNDVSMLEDTGYVFSPEDLVWGAGVRPAGQNGFAIFKKKDADMPPATVYLGNSQGTFTEYALIRPEDQP
jgi:hypothetical protein